jgi:recombination protein RecR
MEDNIEKLTEYFAKLPSIGPRQARRIVYFLSTQNASSISVFGRVLENLPRTVSLCTKCFRHFPKDEAKNILCKICSDSTRSNDALMIVEKEVDFENIERSHIHAGFYFILGGTVSLTGRKRAGVTLRFSELEKIVSTRIQNGLSEIILAFSTHPEGEETAVLTREKLGPLIEKHDIKLSTLGRGLSTGAELEYADLETIKNAWVNRK